MKTKFRLPIKARYFLYALLAVVLTTFKKIIITLIAFTHIAASAVIYYPMVCIFFGLKKANRFMDNIALNYINTD